MEITKFEDLKSWQEAKMLRKMVSNIFNKSVRKKDFTLCNQLKSSALSITANITEGFEGGTNKENIVFLTYIKL